jgi:hypothetical protein
VIKRSTQRRARVNPAVAAYGQWSARRDAVHGAYRVWIAASASDKPLAFEAYQAALDCEERAAKTYAERMSGIGHPCRNQSRAPARVDRRPTRNVAER